MAELRHTVNELKQMQSLPLDIKIKMSCRRIQEWYDYWEGDVYVSFSGGKDSTVLMDLVKNKCGLKDVPIVFVDTGLEFPEVRKFARSKADIVLKPEKNFVQVLTDYGYPVLSKELSLYIRQCQHPTEKNKSTRKLRLEGIRSDGVKVKKGKISEKWKYLVDANFRISEECCDIMKKRPVKKYAKETQRKPFIGTMTSESLLRQQRWLQDGCNAFNKKDPSSQPMSFWTEQNVLEYIKENNLEIASAYGDIVEENGELKTTKCDRTGCVFCMFGCHLEKEPNRFQLLAETHPRLYDYCINGGEYNEDGVWQPSKDGLGIGHVLDFIGVNYK